MYFLSEKRYDALRLLIIPIFIPHAGCPHDCCFCNQKIISGNVRAPSAEEIHSMLEGYFTVAHRYDAVQAAFYGGSFSGLALPQQSFYLNLLQPYLKDGSIGSIRISTRPDYIDPDILTFLYENGVSVIELGAQSMDDRVLRMAGRGHCADDTERAARLIKERGIQLGLQTMTGLPGADEKTDYETALRIIRLCPDFVRIYPTVVVRNTKLAQMYEAGAYLPPSLSETVTRCAELVSLYENAGIPVIRIGLQSSDRISSAGGDVVAGPYHPAFGQLVRSHLALMRVCRVLREMSDSVWAEEADLIIRKERDKLLLYVPENQISVYIGQKRRNIDYLCENFGFAGVEVRGLGRNLKSDAVSVL